MTETQTIIPPMPQHIDITRRIAATEDARAQQAAADEARLSNDLTELQQRAAADIERINAEVDAVRQRAEAEKKRITDHVSACQAALVKAGRDRMNAEFHANSAHESIGDWCLRQGIDPAALPPLPLPEPPSSVSGPLPITQAQPGVQELLARGQAAATPPAGVTLPDPGGDPAEQAGFHAPEDTDAPA